MSLHSHPVLSVCFTKRKHHPPRKPFVYAQTTMCEDYPKRITSVKHPILAQTRGFLVNRGPPEDWPMKGEKVKSSKFKEI